MDQPDQMTLTFRCPPGLETMIPQPIPAVLGLPDWFKALPPKAFNATMGEETQRPIVVQCQPRALHRFAALWVEPGRIRDRLRLQR